MYKAFTLICASLFSLMLSTECAFAKEPRNLDYVKDSLVKYYDSGEYLKDLSKTIDQSMLYLKTRLANEAKTHSNKKFAIVLDIDETSLSNYPDIKRMHFGGTYEQMTQAEDASLDPVIKPTLELFRYAKENNIAVFFVTGRKEHSRDATIKNLTDAGYKNWDGLILKPEDYREKTAAPYKIGAREQIEKEGYTIIMNIGDQESDLAGKHADKTFKLVNPYYFIP